MDEITIQIIDLKKGIIIIDPRKNGKRVSISGGGMTHLRILLEIALREWSEHEEYKINGGE